MFLQKSNNVCFQKLLALPEMREGSYPFAFFWLGSGLPCQKLQTAQPHGAFESEPLHNKLFSFVKSINSCTRWARKVDLERYRKRRHLKPLLLLPLSEGAQAEDRYDDEADASDDARGRRPDEGIRHSD